MYIKKKRRRQMS